MESKATRKLQPALCFSVVWEEKDIETIHQGSGKHGGIIALVNMVEECNGFPV